LIINATGKEYGTYRYIDSTGCGLDFVGMVEDLNSFPEGSIILFHSCAHNPSGIDPTDDQWRVLLEVCKLKKFLPLFDNGFLL
jgi:aspartate aminotransferase